MHVLLKANAGGTSEVETVRGTEGWGTPGKNAGARERWPEWTNENTTLL